MKQSTDLGQNRTGASVAPKLSEAMLQGAESVSPTQGDVKAFKEMRMSYMQEAAPLGSSPQPPSLKGKAKAGMQSMLGRQPTLLMDKIGERLAFERTGTRLYESLLLKYDAHGSWQGGPTRQELEEFTRQELAHFGLCCEAVETLGGDPTALTPAADVSGVASEGLLKVVTDPRTDLMESLHAILVAELADNDGWEMLVTLAEDMGHSNLAEGFRQALSEEENHLAHVRQWLTVGTRAKAKSDLEEKKPAKH